MKRLISLIACIAIVACSGIQSMNIETNRANANYAKESGANFNYGGNNTNANINYKRTSSAAQ